MLKSALAKNVCALRMSSSCHWFTGQLLDQIIVGQLFVNYSHNPYKTQNSYQHCNSMTTITIKYQHQYLLDDMHIFL